LFANAECSKALEPALADVANGAEKVEVGVLLRNLAEGEAVKVGVLSKALNLRRRKPLRLTIVLLEEVFGERFV
jgi:hypothetical protein